jgi:phage baseplate assembly protein W
VSRKFTAQSDHALTQGSVHSIMYTAEGKQVMQRLWDETLKELSFAGVGEIVQSMSKESG